MIFESRKVESRGLDPSSLSLLLFLSVATSIDALGVGVSLPFMDISLLPTAITIGVITFFLSLGGVYIGFRIGHVFENLIEVLGGLVLIAIGLRILIQHLAGI
jgi:putative Mn2+ efflux pump MntP